MNFFIKLLVMVLTVATMSCWYQLKAMNENPKNTWFIENEFEEDVLASPSISEDDDIFEPSGKEEISKIANFMESNSLITNEKNWMTNHIDAMRTLSLKRAESYYVNMKSGSIPQQLEKNCNNPEAVMRIKNCNNPEAVMRIIEELAKTYGSDKRSMSSLILEKTLKKANLSLYDSLTWPNHKKNILQLICDGTFKSEYYLDCIKIILDTGDKQTIYKLITVLDDDGTSAWDNAYRLKDKNIIELFKEWCNKNDIITELDQLLSADPDQSKIESMAQESITEELKKNNNDLDAVLRAIEKLLEIQLGDDKRTYACLLQQIAEEIKSLLSSRPWYHGIIGESEEEKLKINDLINNFISSPIARLIRLPSIYQLKIKNIASQLKKYQHYPQLVLRMIDKLAKTYGSGDGTISALLLKAGLKKAKMSLADIIETKSEKNCLHIIADNVFAFYCPEKILDCVQIILDTGDKESTYHLIAEQKNWGHKSAWDRACIEENQKVITIFSDWARKNSIKLVKKEFFKGSPKIVDETTWKGRKFGPHGGALL